MERLACSFCGPLVVARVLTITLLTAMSLSACGSEESGGVQNLNPTFSNPSPQGTGTTNPPPNNSGGANPSMTYIDLSSHFATGPTTPITLMFPQSYQGFCNGSNATWVRDASTPATVTISNPTSCSPQITLGANFGTSAPAIIRGTLVISATQTLRFAANVYRRHAPSVSVAGASPTVFMTNGYCEASPMGQYSGPHNFAPSGRLRLRRTPQTPVQTQFRDAPTGCNFQWNRFFQHTVTSLNDPTPFNLGHLNDLQVSVRCNDVSGFETLINRSIGVCQSLCPFSASLINNNGTTLLRTQFTGAPQTNSCVNPPNSSSRFTLTNGANNTQCYNADLGQARVALELQFTTSGGSTSVPLGYIDFETDHACQ